ELARVEAKLAVARIDAPAVEAKAPEPARAPASAPIGDPAHALHKADWRAIAPGGARGAHGALEIRSIELPGGLIGVLSLYASSEPAPGAEFAIQFACRVVGQRGSMNFQSVDLSVAGARLPAISLGIGAYGLFHARLSKAEAESFVQTLRDASALRLVAYGDSFEKIGLPRRETDVEIEDAARTAIRAFALSLSSTTVAHPPPVDAQRKPLAKRGR
ncbi:MAG: hypothetical protein C3F11_12000, partial [Methylocystaceae bacterium]